MMQAVWETLTEDSSLGDLLSSYGGFPAVFTSSPVPEDAELPYVRVAPVSDVPFDCKDRTGRDVVLDIACFSEMSGSDAEIDSIAERIRAIFHRASISIGSGTVLSLVAGLSQAPTGEDVVGRIVTVRLVFEE